MKLTKLLLLLERVTEAYNFAVVVATLAYLIPYLVSAIFQLKPVVTGETYDENKRFRKIDKFIAFLALLYSLWVIKTGIADMKTFLLGMGLFVVGVLLYPIIMKETSEVKESKKVA